MTRVLPARLDREGFSMLASSWLVLLAAAAAMANAASAQAASRPQVAVRIGHQPGQDACGSLGQVVLRRGGFLAVRSGPAVRYREIDRLGRGRRLWLCEEKAGWYGVVYPRRQASDCDVGSPVASRRAYAGPCRQGWVRAAYVEVIAG